MSESVNSVLCVSVYMHSIYLHLTKAFISDIVAYLANCFSFNKLECSRGIIIRLGMVSLDQVEVVFSPAKYSCHHGSNTGTVQISEEFDLFKNLLERV